MKIDDTLQDVSDFVREMKDYRTANKVQVNKDTRKLHIEILRMLNSVDETARKTITGIT
ncbi:hypothetical protein ACFL5V_05820 [Fibrobacterota bacterium]